MLKENVKLFSKMAVPIYSLTAGQNSLVLSLSPYLHMYLISSDIKLFGQIRNIKYLTVVLIWLPVRLNIFSCFSKIVMQFCQTSVLFFCAFFYVVVIFFQIFSNSLYVLDIIHIVTQFCHKSLNVLSKFSTFPYHLIDL